MKFLGGLLVELLVWSWWTIGGPLGESLGGPLRGHLVDFLVDSWWTSWWTLGGLLGVVWHKLQACCMHIILIYIRSKLWNIDLTDSKNLILNQIFITYYKKGFLVEPK